MHRDRHQSGLAKSSGVVHDIRLAREIAQPPGSSPTITDIPYRAVSIFPSIWLARTRVTANQITLLWGFLGLIAVTGLAWPSQAVRIGAAVLLEFSYLLDFVDGEVARLQHRTSKRGFFYDLSAHGLIKAGLFLAVGYHVNTSVGGSVYLILAFLACVTISNANSLPFFAAHAGVRPNEGDKNVEMDSQQSRKPFLKRVFSLAGLFFESPGIYALVLLAALFDRFDWLLLFYGFLGPFWYLYRLRKFRYE